MPLNERQNEFKTYLKDRLFDRVRPLTFDELEMKAYGFAELLFDDLGTSEVEEILQELTMENTVEMAQGSSVVDRTTFRAWIAERKEAVDTPRWDAYEKLLVDRDWEANVISALDAQSDDVVELLGDPTQHDGLWPRRGLLMGDVQSGKTANYLGILNKALDYGYRIIVVIGGHTEDLRQQTQSRFDTDLIGVNSETWDDGINEAAVVRVGVGTTPKHRWPNLMTTVRYDFSLAKRKSGITSVHGETPTIFITKKLPGLLENIRQYLKTQAGGERLDVPMIVVDDESDWGSPNTRDKSDPTSVNRAIRALLDVSNRTSYLAITATPFANIFIDDKSEFEFIEKASRTSEDEATSGTRLKDLFPSDYIRVMSPPSTYLGIDKYFSDDAHAALNTNVEDCLALIPIKHKNHHPVPRLPDSLRVAVLQFLIGTAVRRIRDDKTKAASMLVNVSRFKSVERQVAELLDLYLQKMVAVIQSEFMRQHPKKSDNAKRIREIWNCSFNSITDVAWSDVRSKLFEIASEFRIDLVNGDTVKDRAKRRRIMTSGDRKADDLVPKIVVGGDILSRGLTLDGLQVSYFVREPRTMDTLMQMGRWFGFRPNFDDLVRIWMPETTRQSFKHSAQVTDELRETLLDMKAGGLTPRDFGLRVRVHPDSVDIVAANKGRDTELVELGPTVWENRLAESYDLSGDDTVNDDNQIAVERFINQLGPDSWVETSGGFKSWHHISLESIVDFFRGFQGDRQSQWFGRGTNGLPPIADSFQLAPGCNDWSVVLVSSGEAGVHHFGEDFAVNMSRRNNMGRSTLDGHIHLDRGRVSTGTDVIASLLRSERDALLNDPPVAPSGKKLSPQASVLAWIRHPILMIYVVTADSPKSPQEPHLAAVEPGLKRVAVTIAFPKMTQSQIVHAAHDAKTYQVNQVFWRAYNGYVEDFGDDEFSEERD